MRYLALIAPLLAGLPSPARAQEPEMVTGRWEACFQVDSVNAGAIVETCGVLTFTADSACGVAILEYNIPFDSLFAGLSSSHATVGYSLVGDTLHFGGGIAKGSQPGSCRLYGDEGSLYGSVTLRDNELSGEWGVSTTFDQGPIGHVLMKRRWKQ